MSRATKDVLIMVGAAGSVALLAIGIEIGVPALAMVGAAVAGTATAIKISEMHRNKDSEKGVPPPYGPDNHPTRRSTDKIASSRA